MRNRLIAAAATATVVVEAGHRSGSLNTAGHAAQLGRPLGAVPGSILSPASAGSHRLIREYAATCVTTVDEMAELADPLGTGADTSPERQTDGGEGLNYEARTGLGAETGGVGRTGSGADTGGVSRTGSGAETGGVGRTGSGAETGGDVSRTGSAAETGGARRTGSRDSTGDAERGVLTHLSRTRPASADEIAFRSTLPFSTVSAVLGRLDLAGRARERAGGWTLIDSKDGRR